MKNLINTFEEFKFEFSNNVGFLINISSLPSTFTILGTKNIENTHTHGEGKTKAVFSNFLPLLLVSRC